METVKSTSWLNANEVFKRRVEVIVANSPHLRDLAWNLLADAPSPLADTQYGPKTRIDWSFVLRKLEDRLQQS